MHTTDNYKGRTNVILRTHKNSLQERLIQGSFSVTGGHRTRVAAVTLDNMAERVSGKICLNSAVLTIDFLGISDSIV